MLVTYRATLSVHLSGHLSCHLPGSPSVGGGGGGRRGSRKGEDPLAGRLSRVCHPLSIRHLSFLLNPTLFPTFLFCITNENT